jgi:hypothetical protein
MRKVNSRKEFCGLSRTNNCQIRVTARNGSLWPKARTDAGEIARIGPTYQLVGGDLPDFQVSGELPGPADQIGAIFLKHRGPYDLIGHKSTWISHSVVL